MKEGPNGVDRQPSNGLKVNRQPSKKAKFYRKPLREAVISSRQTSQTHSLKG